MPPPWGRGRPPWWPDDEAWPPRRRPPWAGRRGRPYFRFLLLGGLAAMAVGGALFALAWSITISAFNLLPASPGARIGAPIVPLIALIALAAWLRRSQRARMARDRAAEAQRRSFMADVAHELKTPLAVIRGQAEGIADGIYRASAESVAPILDATRSLEVLIEDLRTLALSEAGALTLAPEPVDLAVLVNDVFATQAHPGVELRADLPAGLKPVHADPVRLRGVLHNLVANAIRHTPPGGTVTVAARQGRAGTEVSVSDTGSGIPPDLLPQVFERFARGPGSPGSGLGLAIAKDVVEAHGGTISAESQPGQGARLRFTLPPPP